MEITPRLELLIKLLCIAIIIFLDITIYLNGKDLSCDKCVINFESKRTPIDSASYKTYQKFNVSIIELYEGYIDNYCKVEFDKNQGYYVK